MTTWTVAAPDAWAPEIQQEMTKALPKELVLRFSGAPGSASQRELLAGADFLLAGPQPVTAEVIAAAPHLCLIHKWGIGVDSIDLDAARSAGVGVAITAGANAHAVAEHAVMMILATLRRLPFVDRELRHGNWLFKEMRAQCRQLSGRTVGILGLGNIGRAVARRLCGFDVEIIYYDPARADAEIESRLGATYVEFEELLARADILTIHCPGGAENRHFIGAQELNAMRDEAILINTARGEIVDSDALLAALRTGTLFGAGLDVFEEEPLVSGEPLLALNNVALSPHTAASVLDNVPRTARHAFDNMLRVGRGEPIPEQDAIIAPRRLPPSSADAAAVG